MARRKYALVGAGSRSGMYISALLDTYKDVGELVALCDTNMTRMAFTEKRHRERYNTAPIPTYHAADFDTMVAECAPDTVIVTSMDRTHHHYICRAMELGCDAVTEKPMTVDEEKCQQILDTIARTGRDLRVTFNYRYSPRSTKVKELLSQGAIGDITSIHFEWLLDTKHGADYFRRWHRDKANSGGLLVHKATHHFDLINWWTDAHPQLVYAMGRLAFYGRQNAEQRGIRQFYSRAQGSEAAANDPFALHLDRDDNLTGMYLNAEHEDGYQRDQSVFGYNISIEDNMGVLVQYDNKAIMTYNLHAHSPWEGFRVMFNGTEGRLEVTTRENSYVSGAKGDTNLAENREGEREIEVKTPGIILQKHWGKPTEVTFEHARGGHGGGDVRLLDHVFRGTDNDPLGHAAGYEDGAYSILTGIAANRAIATGLPVRVRDLVDFGHMPTTQPERYGNTHAPDENVMVGELVHA